MRCRRSCTRATPKVEIHGSLACGGAASSKLMGVATPPRSSWRATDQAIGINCGSRIARRWRPLVCDRELGFGSSLRKRRSALGIEANLERLKVALFEIRPMLNVILQQFGSLSLYELAKRYQRADLVDEYRRDEFIKAFREETAARLGGVVADSAAHQLRSHYFVSTAVHHAPMTHPGTLSHNLLMCLPRLNRDADGLPNVIILACSNISFSNFAFPRGLLMSSWLGPELKMNFIPLFTRAVRPRAVVGFPAYSLEAVAMAKARVSALANDGLVSDGHKLAILELLDDIYADPAVLACRSFGEQITLTNFHLWERLFPLQEDGSELIYLQQERLVCRLLVDYHMNQNTPIHRLLFDPAYQELIPEHLDGIGGGFRYASRVGTYLFWAFPKQSKYRVQLWQDRGWLAASDGSYRVRLSPDDIGQAIARGELVPSSLLCWLLLSFYYGVRLLGGHNQTTYLTQMKNAYQAMQTEYGDVDSLRMVQAVSTTDLVLTRPALAFLQTPAGQLAPATALDMILHGNAGSINAILATSKQIQVAEAVYQMMPDLYRTYYPEALQDEALLAITERDIQKLTGMDRRITAIGLML
jgi:hypothetical protein